MIAYDFDKARAILHVRPQEPLAQSDFESLAAVVDPFISETGDLAGLVIEAHRFPGWSSFAALVAHLRFVRDHHRHIRKIAVVTDSPMANLAEHLVSHFVSAEIRQFPAAGFEEAVHWISA